MNVKEITSMVTSAIIGIILVMTVMTPIVMSGLMVAGNPVEYVNPIDVNAPQHYDKLDNYVVEISATDSDYEVVANGVSMTKTAGGQPVIFSDALTLTLSNNTVDRVGSVIIFGTEYVTLPVDIGVSKSIVITFDNGSWTLKEDGIETYSGEYSWLFGVKTDGDYVTFSGNSNLYVNNVNSDIVFCGLYDTGELDTAYWTYYNGALEVSNPDYSGSFNYSSALVDGTTDIDRISNWSMTITDGTTTEEFAPYRCLVKETIEGHEDSGVTYTLISVLPIFVVIGLLLGVAYMVLFTRRT